MMKGREICQHVHTEALVLLRAGLKDLAPRVFKGGAKIADIPRGIAVGYDLRNPHVKGARPPMLRFINWYIGKLHLAAAHDSGDRVSEGGQPDDPRRCSALRLPGGATGVLHCRFPRRQSTSRLRRI